MLLTQRGETCESCNLRTVRDFLHRYIKKGRFSSDINSDTPSKKDFLKSDIKKEMERIKEECQCDVQHLEHVGVFVLTYQTTAEKFPSRLRMDESKLL